MKLYEKWSLTWTERPCHFEYIKVLEKVLEGTNCSNYSPYPLLLVKYLNFNVAKQREPVVAYTINPFKHLKLCEVSDDECVLLIAFNSIFIIFQNSFFAVIRCYNMKSYFLSLKLDTHLNDKWDILLLSVTVHYLISFILYYTRGSDMMISVSWEIMTAEWRRTICGQHNSVSGPLQRCADCGLVRLRMLIRSIFWIRGLTADLW